MKLFLNVNCNTNEVAKNNNLKLEEFIEIKINEKQLAKPKRILQLIRGPFDEVLFGCIDIEFQRFMPFMELYILFSKAKRGGIVDEFGKKINFSILKTIFKTFPLLLIEALLSAFIVLFSYFYYFLWRKFIIRNSKYFSGE